MKSYGYIKTILRSALLTFIHALNSLRRPSAVLRRVVSIVVDTVNRGVLLSMYCRMLQVARVHVLLKSQKRTPSLAYRNSAPAPVSKMFMGLSIASRPHILPNSVKARSTHPVFCDRFLEQASARPCVPRLQITAAPRNHFAAVTFTFPNSVSTTIRPNYLYGRQPTKPFTRQVIFAL